MAAGRGRRVSAWWRTRDELRRVRGLPARGGEHLSRLPCDRQRVCRAGRAARGKPPRAARHHVVRGRRRASDRVPHGMANGRDEGRDRGRRRRRRDGRGGRRRHCMRAARGGARCAGPCRRDERGEARARARGGGRPGVRLFPRAARRRSRALAGDAGGIHHPGSRRSGCLGCLRGRAGAGRPARDVRLHDRPGGALVARRCHRTRADCGRRGHGQSPRVRGALADRRHGPCQAAVGAVLPLSDASAAHARLERREALGKIVLVP